MRTFICAFLYVIFILTLNALEIKGIFLFAQIGGIVKVLICVCVFLMGCGILMAVVKDLREIT